MKILLTNLRCRSLFTGDPPRDQQEIDIVNKVRPVAAAIVGLTLAATGVMAATSPSQAPTNVATVVAAAQNNALVGGANNNHGGAVSALAKAINASTTASAPTTPTTGTTGTAGAQGTHGAAVSVVAQNSALVGGTNNNHGGAVSAVARGTHGPSAPQGKSAGKSQAGTRPATH